MNAYIAFNRDEIFQPTYFGDIFCLVFCFNMLQKYASFVISRESWKNIIVNKKFLTADSWREILLYMQISWRQRNTQGSDQCFD